jgi:hypothetical protein
MKQTPHRAGIAEMKAATAMSFSHGSGLLFFKDKHSKLSFLVYSRATFSILPCSSAAVPIGPQLIWANGTSIPTLGFQIHTLAFGDKTFTHDLLFAKVVTPILGLDFFRKFQLSIYPLQAQALDKDQRHITSLYVATPVTLTQPVRLTGPQHTTAGGKCCHPQTSKTAPGKIPFHHQVKNTHSHPDTWGQTPHRHR